VLWPPPAEVPAENRWNSWNNEKMTYIASFSFFFFAWGITT
jgi:hypothetical protein